MLGRKVRFTEENKDYGARMPFTDLGNLGNRMPVARADLAQIFPRHAIQAIDALAVLARGYQQFIKRRPIVSPVSIKADALAKFIFIDFAPPPLVEHMLMA